MASPLLSIAGLSERFRSGLGLFALGSSSPVSSMAPSVNDSHLVQPAHPYYPLGLQLAGYAANQDSVLKLLTIFAAGCTVILGATGIVAKRIQPRLKGSELAIVMWFMLCGCIHLFFEGYFAFNSHRMAGLQSLFGQLWKEYALSDSRYLTQDPFVLCMETITAVSWGPLSFVLVALVTTQHPLRHPFQIIVSLGQLYGDVLYYATSMFEHYSLDIAYSRPEAYYFWGYYWLMNAFWIVIPSLLIWQSIAASAESFRAMDRVSKTLEAMDKETKKDTKKRR